MMQNGRINSPSLEFACPQANIELGKHDHKFIERGVAKRKYRYNNIIFINDP